MTTQSLKKFAQIVALIVVCITGTYSAIFGWMVYSSPLTYAEMDFNRDGKVEFFEADYASSYGERASQRDGEKCIEFFALKDGLPLKVDCSGGESQIIEGKTHG